ncbi:MAG: endonuclease [Clostridia bacterium]|nr:endonuclease [Clostridia bacterium]
MRKIAKFTLALALVACIAVPTLSTQNAYAAKITSTPSGYTDADDVVYKTSGGIIANWGARGEDATFLSTYAESFYTGNYTYEVLSKVQGGSSQSNAPSSTLYKSLKSAMSSKHTHETAYQETRYQYCYTDCERNNTSQISSFYSGKTLSGTWDSGKTWNREHTWPNSKGLAGNDENDIMMLRPTSVSENSSRGNTAYGASVGYYDPGESVRGDCARIVLYVYVRWGNTSKMWGTSGVMESLNVLLDWMEEDPVDTWEMGRNDAVQSITGTRNIFIDYPEYAWLLFGREIPEDMVTPSGDKSQETPPVVTPPVDSSPDDSSSSSSPDDSSSSSSPDDSSSSSSPDDSSSSSSSDGHRYTDWIVVLQPTETQDGRKIKKCYDCGEEIAEVIPKLGQETGDPDCEHVYSDWIVTKQPTATQDGEQVKMCYTCMHEVKEILPKTGEANSTTGCKAIVAMPCGVALLGAACYLFFGRKE